MSKKEDYVAALQKIGYAKATDQPSRKYTKMVKPGFPPLWLGKAGAVRRGSTVTGAYAVANTVKNMMLRDSSQLRGY